ncbi:MAG: Methionine-tRNA ligase [Candidatus Jorgensenbacteria bacterium GW2011_GWA1_48_11]|uniref:Methionine--tRNA ligase n=1 Tax=Candidatus Jorgensenbacteria bacterium GW2011_GWA1_48_11 TaxID=1618660 RepID=A0A0G1UCC9_9BACT|nr:MAG: Methionine-tRNA ligase [Candidatus Jorgensenbacteria bacterium GW2011_GWA1_48_11]KKW12292.1 MAG: Methionine-tRNA ligase [Candidatus Jorgensenbacteria bacterium GW2011_GWB1_49_9]
MISLEDFKKLDLRVARILAAEKVEGADKLLKLQLDLGDPATGSGLGQKQIVSGIAGSYAPDDLIGREIIVIANLEPRVLRGVESQGMLLAASDNGQIILLQPDREAAPGSKVS